MRQQKLIIEQDYLFSMIRLIFIFLTCFYMFIHDVYSLLQNFFYILCRHYLIIYKKKLILKAYPPQNRSFEHRICDQTQDLQIFKKCYMSQMYPKEALYNVHCILSSTTLQSRSLPLNNILYIIVLRYFIHASQKLGFLFLKKYLQQQQ